MPQRYIVVFKNHATNEQIDAYANSVETSGGAITARYDSVLKGFAASIPDNLLSTLQVDDIVDYIEPDGIVTTQ